jgi:Rap1a immunity proteins
MKTVLLCSALAMFVCAPLANAETAEEMLSACRPVANASVSNSNVNLPQTFEGGLCWGSFSIIQNLTTLLDIKTGNREFSVCTPENSTRTQLIAAFVEYIKQKPQRYSEEFLVVVLDSLRESFPCTDRGKR